METNIEQLVLAKYSDFYNTKDKLKIVLGLINSLSNTNKNYLIDLLQDKETENIEVEGFTVERLQKEHRMNLVASVLTLQYLQKDPKKTLESLNKGHDKVTY